MFNVTVVKPGTSTAYAKTVTTHEHKAPTDQSVDLLRDMEKHARQEIVQTIVGTTDNTLNFKSAWFQKSSGFGHVFCYTIIINGKEIRGEYTPEIPFHLAHARMDDIRKMIRHCLDCVVSDIVDSFLTILP
jgi:hypothetical protein